MDVQPDETGETIPFTLARVIDGGSTWEPEQETLIRGKAQSTRPKEVYVEGMYQKVSKKQAKP